MNNELISGIIDKFIFRNEETGYSVLLVAHKGKDKTTVVGTFADIQAGQEVQIEGHWKFHKKFGKQFIAESYITTLPTSALGIKKYLSSGFIKGIGKVYAEKIVDCFGSSTLEIIDKYPGRLLEVDGIGKKRVQEIKNSWTDQKFIAKIMVFLREKGVSSTYATKIYKKYGNDSIALLTENPYRLTDDIWGIGFSMADKIAQNMGFATGSVERFQAGILYILKEEMNSGNVYQEIDELKNKTFQILEIDPIIHQKTMSNGLRNLYEKDKIKLISDDEKHFVGLSLLYHSEKGIADKIKNLLDHKVKKPISENRILSMLQSNNEIKLNEEQQRGIISCINEKVNIITGGPGTGKTTILKSLLKILNHHQISFKLAAPTGRAAKKMMESTGNHAVTVHRLLEFDPSIMGFARNEQNSLKADVIIIDEASMLDIFLMHSIIKAVPLSSNLILIGDVDQLPSVGAGNVLNDLINSKKISCIKLEQIYRQAKNSMIIQNAHKINHGEFPSGSIEGCKKDFYFIKEENPEDCFEIIKKILKTTIKKHNIPLKNVAILTPMNRGAVGTQKLNFDIQQFLNSQNNERTASFAGTTYKINDKVMQIKNNYDKKVFNGDIGIIKNIDLEEKEAIIDFYDQYVTYSFDELNELVLAYAITIHKSQGSEYDAVIIPIFMQHFMLLQRNLIYTAITRAKKLCIFVGQTKALAIGVKNGKQKKRVTFLDKFLTDNLLCR